METKAKIIDLKEIKLPKIHGETAVHLYNPKTKIKNIIRSENTFQGSVIANFLSSMGENQHTTPSFNWSDIVGGLFLFEDTINSSASYMPAGNNMVGNGAYGITNNSAPYELGSYSGSSGIVEENNQYKLRQIYDYTTSQANGTISCACLTSRIGGMIGYGNNTGRQTEAEFDAGQTSQIVDSAIAGNVCIINNIFYTFTLVDDNLTVKKVWRSITQGSVFKGVEKTSVIDLSSYKPTGVTLSTDLRVFPLNNNKIRIYSPYMTQILPAGHVNYFDYDPSDESITPGYIANISNYTIRGDVVAVTFTPDGYLVTYDTDRYLQVFSSSAHVIDYRTEVLMDWVAGGRYDVSINDGLFVAYALGVPFMVDFVNHTVKPMNMASRANYGIANNRFPSIDALAWCQGGWVTRLIKNPLYLATINNFDAPFTKTAEQTMKVIYTLEEV